MRWVTACQPISLGMLVYRLAKGRLRGAIAFRNAWIGVSARRKTCLNRKIVLVQNNLAVAAHEFNLGRR